MGSDSERCREYRERKKKEKQSDDEELRSLEIKNYCLHHSHEEMQRKIVKYRQLVKIIAIQAGISHPISPDLRQRINQAVKNAIFDIGFSFYYSTISTKLSKLADSFYNKYFLKFKFILFSLACK